MPHEYSWSTSLICFSKRGSPQASYCAMHNVTSECHGNMMSSLTLMTLYASTSFQPHQGFPVLGLPTELMYKVCRQHWWHWNHGRHRWHRVHWTHRQLWWNRCCSCFLLVAVTTSNIASKHHKVHFSLLYRDAPLFSSELGFHATCTKMSKGRFMQQMRSSKTTLYLVAPYPEAISRLLTHPYTIQVAPEEPATVEGQVGHSHFWQACLFLM